MKMLKKLTALLALAVVVLAGASSGLMLGQTEGTGTGTIQVFIAGPRGPFMALFRSLQAGDLVLLQNGGLLSGTVKQQVFKIGDQAIPREKILLIAWPAAGAATSAIATAYLKDGTQVQGVMQGSILERLPTGEELSLAIAQLRGLIFKVELPVPPAPTPGQEGPPPSQGPSQEELRQAQGALFSLFSGLQGSALLQAVLEGLQKFDLLVFPNGQVLSATIENKAFILESPIFGRHTLAVADLSQIVFDDPDVVVLRIGDRVSGIVTPDGDGRVRATLATGSAVSLAKGDLGGLTFRLPAGPLGGGGRPRFQPGPGR